MRSKKGTKGITLIALVITIIVLLILAGVAIATLLGDNGIITKATTAKENTTVAGEKERLKIGYSEAKAKKLEQGNREEITAEELNDELSNDKVEATVKENSAPIEVTFKKTGNTYTINGETGEIEGPTKFQGDNPSNVPSGDEKLAKEVLKTNPNGNEDYEKSPYVKYNGMICRVLYNDDEHGLQIITAKGVDHVTLGSEDSFEEAKESYNNAVDILNNKAKEYMDENGIATDARCLGSFPKLKEGKFEGDTTKETNYTNDYDYFSEYNNQFKPGDNNYEEDVNQLNKLKITSGGWLASRFLSGGETYYLTCGVYFIEEWWNFGSSIPPVFERFQ